MFVSGSFATVSSFGLMSCLGNSEVELATPANLGAELYR